MKRNTLRQQQHIDSARLFLQVLVALGALVPILAGIAGVIMGPNMIEHHGLSTVTMDSHFRYLSGLLLGIGLGFLSTIPHIEKQTIRFRLLAMIVFIGGLSRLASLIMIGTPGSGMIFALVMELIVVPILVLAQTAASRWCNPHQ